MHKVKPLESVQIVASDNDNISSDHANPVVGALCKQNVNIDTVVHVPPSDNDDLKRSPVAKSGMFIDLPLLPTVRSLLSDENVIHVLQKIKSNLKVLYQVPLLELPGQQLMKLVLLLTRKWYIV